MNIKQNNSGAIGMLGFVWFYDILTIVGYLSRAKPDEVKMVLYSRGVWNALFSSAVY